jgi:putative Mg2+ transporter-C (MgtC) family protein
VTGGAQRRADKAASKTSSAVLGVRNWLRANKLRVADINVGIVSSGQTQESLLDKFQIIPHVIALAGAYVLAFPIGWDREKEARSAGLRTFPLVALASCGFVQATETLLADSPEGTARVVQGLITGVGFIGGGAILKHGSSVLGTATAASLWATGAIGTAVGLGSFDVAVTIAAFTFITLKLIPLLKPERESDAAGSNGG